MIALLSFESIAKTNTTQTSIIDYATDYRLRVLLKQIQHKHEDENPYEIYSLRVLLKQIQHKRPNSHSAPPRSLRVLLKQIQHKHHQFCG